MAEAKTKEPEAPAEDVPRETGEAKDENHCPRHPDQLLEVTGDPTAYGSTTFEQCPQCRSEDTKAEKAAAKEEAEPREKGS